MDYSELSCRCENSMPWVTYLKFPNYIECLDKYVGKTSSFNAFVIYMLAIEK